MKMTIKNIRKMYIFFITSVLFVSSCSSLSPGSYIKTDSSWVDPDEEFIFFENKKIIVKEITHSSNNFAKQAYKIGQGDELIITVYGMPEIFPMGGVSDSQILKTVNSNGEIFFPFAGEIKAINKTKEELRFDLSERLSKSFTDPQVDVQIKNYKSQRIYILGEVNNPKTIFLQENVITLADALGEVKGINNNTSDASNIFVIRQSQDTNIDGEIYKASLDSPSGYLLAGKFELQSQDIIYVNPKGTTRWNRVISQFFPFSTFLNSIDNLTDNN